jgi:predicted TIM-barrel fold metal-dependent hydrolase
MSHKLRIAFSALAWSICLFTTFCLICNAQEENSPASVDDISLKDFNPQAQLHVPRTKITAAKYPVVDAHTHFMLRTRHDKDTLKQIVAMLDANNIAVCVSLDGKLGEQLDRHIEYLWTEHRDRFVIYSNIDFRGNGASNDPKTWACNQPDFVRNTCEQLKAAHARGISGLKFFKQFGLNYRNADGSLIRIDDERFDPIWRLCGELKIPIIMHTADPSAFFLPINARNERAEELLRHPDWSYYGQDVPAREELHAARSRVIARFPETTFIAAHMANDAEDLQQVATWLDTYPNLIVEIASRISELGRTPYSSRDFLIKYQDRVMFGTDGPWPAERLNAYWRFLETKDEWFAYSEKSPPPQGLWNITGVYLPDEVLRKLYHQNAAKYIPGVAERLSKATKD